MSNNSTAAVGETAANNGKSKVTTKDPALKLAHKRLSVLQLAEALGNASEAWWRSGPEDRGCSPSRGSECPRGY